MTSARKEDVGGLEALAKRCEEATGPDRELDIAIAFAIGRVYERDDNILYATGNDSDMVVEPNAYDDHIVAQPLPYYTSSIDAALTLVPDGWTRAVDATAPEHGIDVDLYLTTPKLKVDVRGCSETEPLATCAAALRARQQGE